ncbi:hypothetical protein CHS0354_028852 [Potamilus streckersoni]|uniref:UBA domain-containing protein n=1 Tax=Potamilus streckersoni TaxID=2493646 RepID=A0AAE0WDK2_9BIVA|nr:hypothetical protein CHS0354_028852 [Potamilus streckersoni]
MQEIMGSNPSKGILKTFKNESSSHGSSQDIGSNWQNNSDSGTSAWLQTKSNNIIVDRNDKEAWPSIGDKSESASENGDGNASVKSGSVISLSSTRGQSTSQETNNQDKSAMQSQSASSMWSANSNFSGPDSNWGVGFPSSSAANVNSLGWASAPSTSLSMSNNQGHNMQSGASSAGSDTYNSINSNPMLGSSRFGWGAPGTLPGQGAGPNKMSGPGSQATSGGSGNTMQGLVSFSGAQQNGPQAQLGNRGNSGPSNPSLQQQGNSTNTSAFQAMSGYQQKNGSANGDLVWSGNTNLGMNPGGTTTTSVSGNNAQSGDNLTSSWGAATTSSSDMSKPGTAMWGTPNQNSGSDWGITTSSQQGIPAQQTPQAQQSAGMFNNPDSSSTNAGPANNSSQQRPSSWAQAAGKGLNLHSSTSTATVPSAAAAIDPREEEIRRAIENHEGWGRRPIRQDTSWNVELSPKAQRKFSSSAEPKGTSSNMWNSNNNNGTAIWEANKDGTGVWNSTTGAQRPGWSSGPPQKPPEPVGSQWSGVPPEKPIGAWGGSENSQPPSNWGQKTETGSWGGTASGTNQMGNNWGDSTPHTGNDGSPYWGEPPKPTGTNYPPPTQRMKPDDQWQNKPTGWGDPSGPPDTKVDDGTSIWAANAQQQARAGGWGDTGQWNPAMGKPPPSAPNTGWVDGDMNWNDPNRKNFSGKFPGGGQPPQRSRLLQQLMDLGFKKDDAQHALISNNMNLQSALSDLYGRQGPSANKDDNDMDVFLNGAKHKTPGSNESDISDTQFDSNSFVPNINSMQNTPLPNAQSQLPNQYSFKTPSLPQSSLNHVSNPSIIFQKQKNSINQPPQGQVRGQLPTTQNVAAVQQQQVNQQQMAQQQILQQLRMAVHAGLISPQLLNQQLPPAVLLMLQQLLQNQQLLQQQVTTQQMLQQNKMGQNPLLQRQHLEQVTGRINGIKQQILILQKQISQAQNNLLKPQAQQQQQNTSSVVDEPLNNIQPDMGNLVISSSQSRLNQWKRPTPEKESDGSPVSCAASVSMTGGEQGTLNKAVGSKPTLHQSSSNPNLQGFGDLGLTKLGMGGDQTWSTTNTPSQNWPTTSAQSTTSSSQSTDSKENSNNKESQSTNSTSSATSATSTAANSGSGSITSTSVLNINDTIPEFIPGKPWTGITKSVEDDPHITPGSFSQYPSVNTIKDDYLMSLTKSSSNTEESNSPWLSKTTTQTNRSMSLSDSFNNFPSDVWIPPLGQQKGGLSTGGGLSRPPPGLQSGGKTGWTGTGGFNRQHSWAGPRTDPASIQQGSWSTANASKFLILKNLTPQIDGSTLRTLCMQHGPLHAFYLFLNHGSALVQYSSKEEAIKAQKSLNTCVLGNTTIVAEFVSDYEAARLVENQSAMSVPSQWSQPVSPAMYRQTGQLANRNDGLGNPSWKVVAPATNPNVSFNNPLPGNVGNVWGGGGIGEGGGTRSGLGVGSGIGSGSGGLWSIDDHATNNFLGNMLGGTM